MKGACKPQLDQRHASTLEARRLQALLAAKQLCALPPAPVSSTTGMTGANYADSWVDIKGSGFMVADNVGYNTVLDGFQTHDQDTPNSGGLCGWGPAGAQAAGALGCNSACGRWQVPILCRQQLSLLAVRAAAAGEWNTFVNNACNMGAGTGVCIGIHCSCSGNIIGCGNSIVGGTWQISNRGVTCR